MLKRRTVRVITASGVIFLAASAGMSGRASADPQGSLTTAVDNFHGSRCPPLQSDPLVTRVAQMANQESSDYIHHRSALVPFTDPMPALKTIGYTGSKAKLLSGYGKNEHDSIYGLLLEGHDTLGDCTFTQYGVDTLEDVGFILTSVVLARP
jgi:hypothetical protein